MTVLKDPQKRATVVRATEIAESKKPPWFINRQKGKLHTVCREEVKEVTVRPGKKTIKKNGKQTWDCRW